MSTALVSAPALLTAEQFAQRPDPGHPEELVKGRILAMPLTTPRHGQICNKAGRILGNHAEAYNLGEVVNNDAAIITQRNPDTVRGADVAFYSFARVPKGMLPAHYFETVPDLVVEVVSPSDRWPNVLAKVAEFLEAGVIAVLVLDDQRRLAHLYRADGITRILGADDDLTVPDVLGDFSVKIGNFFE